MKISKNYIIFMLSQNLSNFGSRIATFAVSLWILEKGDILSFSLSLSLGALAYVTTSFFTGRMIDRIINKKYLLYLTDTLAVLATSTFLYLYSIDRLEVKIIYIGVIISNICNAMQNPLAKILLGELVDKDNIQGATSLNYTIKSIYSIAIPFVASTLYFIDGLRINFLVDIITFSTSIIAIYYIKIPVSISKVEEKSSFSIREFFKENKLILYLISYLSIINFFSTLTFENLLSPYILLQSNNNYNLLAWVHAFIPLGIILGSFFVKKVSVNRNKLKLIIVSVVVSNIFANFILVLSNNYIVYLLSILFSTLPIPLINALENYILLTNIQKNIQGRVLSFRSSIQFSTEPFGYFLGGYLANNIMEPFMKKDSRLSNLLKLIFGSKEGNGIAIIFFIAGVLSILISIYYYSAISKEVYEDYKVKNI